MAKLLEFSKQRELEELLREGYEATAELTLKIHREFEPTEHELDWDY